MFTFDMCLYELEVCAKWHIMTHSQVLSQTQEGSKLLKQQNCEELRGTLLTFSTKGACRGSGIRLGRVTSFNYLFEPTSNQPTSWLIHFLEHLWCQDKSQAIPDSQDSPRPKLGGSHHLPPYSIFCTTPREWHPNGFLSQDSQMGVPKSLRLGVPQLCRTITSGVDLRSGRGLNQSCSPRRELSNDMSHATSTPKKSGRFPTSHAL